MNLKSGHLRKLTLLCFALVLAPHLIAEPSAAAVAAFNTYAHTVESRLSQQHNSPNTFLVLPADPSALSQLRSGQPLIEQITTPTTHGGLLHHWRATAFVPNGTVADFVRLLQHYPAYPRVFAPQILSSTVLSHTPTDTILRLRTRQHHVITVVLDTTYDVTFGSLDPTHGYSISRSTRVDEIASPGTPSEHALSPSEEHGFLYNLNTCWSYEQRDGGLYLQIESISLTRNIPRGLGWAVQPYIESIPRESLVFTLTAAHNALHK
jgi:hypothetical protein